MNNTFFSKYWC